MTREEAIKILDPKTCRDALMEFMGGSWNQTQALVLIGEAQKMGLDALHTKQSTAKLDRSRWGKCEMCGDGEVNASPGAHDFIIADDCLFYNDSESGLEVVIIKYCPFCSRPLTEEAWAELERRIGGRNGTTN